MWLTFYYFLSLYMNLLQQNVVIANPLVGEMVRVAREGEFPSVVSIKVINDTNPEPERNQACTGTLVSKRDVLTAEHCFKLLALEHMEIIVGSIDIRSGIKFYPAWWLTYKEWMSRKHRQLRFETNDIAVIRLRREIPSHIAYSRLFDGAHSTLYGLDVTAAGWGRTIINRIPRFLHRVDLKVLSPIVCENKVERLMGRRIPMPERTFCTIGEPYALLASGDSGGPIFFMDTVAAISLSISPTEDPQLQTQKVNLHLGIEYYKEFILDVIYNC